MDFEYYVKYFSYLEKRLIGTQKYVAFEKENIKTFSLEYASIINDCCGIINGFCFELCREDNADKNELELNDYISYFDRNNYKLDFEVYFLKFFIKPWEKLKNTEYTRTPQWWIDYNKIKHSGKPNFQKATLKNAISCLAGLYVLLFYYDYLQIIKHMNDEDYQSLEISDTFGITFVDSPVSWKC